MSIEAYKSARKRALKDKNTQLPALEDLQPAITRKETLPAGYIPLDKVAGTVTRGRMSAFNKDFLPLLDDHSEFAAKWSHLYDAQLSEGIHDPVSAYEYMGRYYILEGNKRVSVLKYLGAPEILAKITRLIPANDDSPEMNHYFANQQNQQKTGVTWLEFVHPHTDWSRLEIVLDTDKHPWNDKLREDLKSAWTRFKVIFDKKGETGCASPHPRHSSVFWNCTAWTNSPTSAKRSSPTRFPTTGMTLSAGLTTSPAIWKPKNPKAASPCWTSSRKM